MKNKLKITLAATAFIMLNLIFGATAFADSTPPPVPGDHGNTGNQTPSGGGTPVGGGVLILAVLGSAYGAKKWYTENKRSLQE